MTSYHEFNKIDKAKYLVEKLKEGLNIAVITDAGTPGISDPGEELVKQCYEAGIKVTSLPGPAACVTALTISGKATRRFAFEAFLPSDKKERREILSELTNETRTIILYEAPHRLLKTLQELLEYLGEERAISVCKELTKKHEDVNRLTLKEAIDYYEINEPKGEYVLVLEGKSRTELSKEEHEKWENIGIEEHFKLYIEKGIDEKEAMKMVAKDRGISKRDVYSIVKAK